MTERDEELEIWLQGVRPPDLTKGVWIDSGPQWPEDVVSAESYGFDTDLDGNIIRAITTLGRLEVTATILTERGLRNLIETLQGKLERWR